jgi:hypothetical protein
MQRLSTCLAVVRLYVFLLMLQLGMPLLCDDARLGHKGMLHRHVRQLDKPSKVGEMVWSQWLLRRFQLTAG